jgi:O-antigen/teichoic acid export membrane protein
VNSDDLTKRVARGSGFVFAGNIVGKIVSFVLQILLSRTLGRAAYGLYTLGFTVLRFAREVASLGLQGGIVRFGAEDWGSGDLSKLKGTFLASFGIAFGSGVVLGTGLYLGSDWLAVTAFSDAALAPVLRMFGIALPFYAVQYVTSRAARSLQNMLADVSIGVVAQPFFNLVGVALAFALGYGLDGVLVAVVASVVASAALGLYLVARLVPALFDTRPATYRVKSLLVFSAAAFGSSLASLMLDQADRLMLGFLASSEDVGVYNAAALLATQVRFVLSAISATFTPVISDLYHKGRLEELQRLFATTTRWIITLSFPIVLVLLLFPAPLLSLYGPEFRVGTSMLMVLAPAMFINGGVGAAGLMLQMADHERIALANNVLLAILNVLLNWWMITAYGPIGAAMATGLSVALVNLLKLVEVRYLLGMHPYNLAYLKPFAAAAVAAAAGWAVDLSLQAWPLHWIGGMLVVGLTYLSVLALLGFTEDDWTVLGPLLRRVGLHGWIPE